MTLPTYAAIADQLGIPRCRGVRSNGQTCHDFDHRTGEMEAGTTLIHWADRTTTRAGIRRFLMLTAASDLWNEQMPIWEAVVKENTQAAEMARRLHIRLPRHLAEEDKARVRAMVAGLPTNTPGRAAALRWTHA